MLSMQNPASSPSSQPAIFTPSLSVGVGPLSSVEPAPLSPRRSLSRSASQILSPSSMDQATVPVSLQLPESPRLSPRSSVRLPSLLDEKSSTQSSLGVSPPLSPRLSPRLSRTGTSIDSPRRSPRSSLSANLPSGSLQDEEVDEVLVETYLSEMGNEQQLATFFQRYANHQGLSDKCALDGRYFFKVLSPYTGLVDSELFLRINQGPVVVACGGKVHRSFEALDIAFDLNDLARTKDSPARYRLIKFILDIGNDPADNTGGVHTNLIYIDTHKKHIVRFEPMYDEYYSEKINEILKKYFAKILPDYHFHMLHEHPQLPTTESCPSKGMCAAYVLKKAMMLVTGNDRPLNRDPKDEELKIMQFADAIETEYGLLPPDGEPEHGLTIGFSPRPYVSPYGPGAFYGPNIIPYPYAADYYGYVHGPRFARRRGWGWGRKRFHHWGNVYKQEPGVMADVDRRLDASYSEAKRRNSEYGRYPHGKHQKNKNHYQGSHSSGTRGQYGAAEYGGDTHHHYHGCGAENCGCAGAPPRTQPGYWSGPPSTQGQSLSYAYPSRYLSTAVAAPPSTLSSRWNPVPPSRISIGRSPTGAASLHHETTTETQYLDPATGSLVRQSQTTTTPVNSPMSPIGGEFGCGCGGPAKTREENGRLFNMVGGAVLGTLVAGPLGTIAGGAAGYALSRPDHGRPEPTTNLAPGLRTPDLTFGSGSGSLLGPRPEQGESQYADSNRRQPVYL